MAKKGLTQANTLRSNNTTSTGYGIVYADEIIGSRSVKTRKDLDNLPDWVLGKDNKLDKGTTYYVENEKCFYIYTGDGWQKSFKSIGLPIKSWYAYDNDVTGTAATSQILDIFKIISGDDLYVSTLDGIEEQPHPFATIIVYNDEVNKVPIAYITLFESSDPDNPENNTVVASAKVFGAITNNTFPRTPDFNNINYYEGSCKRDTSTKITNWKHTGGNSIIDKVLELNNISFTGNTIKTSEIDFTAATLQKFNNSVSDTSHNICAQYSVVDVTHNNIVGQMLLIGDSLGHMVTEILTTSATLNNGVINWNEHSDTVVNTYIRRNHVKEGGNSSIAVGSWSEWTYYSGESQFNDFKILVAKELNKKVNTSDVVQQTGDSTTSVMSQKAVSHELATKADAEQVNNSLYNLEKKIGDRVVVNGNVTNLPDEEDLTSVKESERDVLKIADRSYAPENFSGKGYKILRKNIVNGKNVLTQDMINQPNTIYEIRYDYNLDGGKIILNEGISICLVGGDIKNGKIVCNNTRIYGNSRLSCNLSGTFFYEGKADGIDLIETNKGISFKDNITYNAKNNKRNKVFLRQGINYKSLMYPKEIIEEYSLVGDDRYMVNTDYFLLDNIDLGGKDSSHWIKFGKGCSLTNLGGSIYNGYVVFTDLKIIGKYPFKDLTDNSSIEEEIIIDENSNIDLSELINTKLQYYYRLTIRLGVGKYELSAPITIPKNKKLIIIGSGKVKYIPTKKQSYNSYRPSGSFLVFNNTDKKYENVSVFSGEGLLNIKNTSLYLLEEDVSYTLNDNPKPSDFNTLVLGNSNINGINTNNLTINNCSLFCFTNAGIVVRQAFQIIENTDISLCRTGIKSEITLTGDEQFINIYIRHCEIGMDLNGGHINITKLWIDEITKYAILIHDNNSSIRIIDLHINHCNYAGIKVKNFNRAMIVGTINRCGCYYAGFDIKDIPEEDLDKCCNIYANSCEDSTLMFNSSYMKVDDPAVQSNYGQVSAPVIDIIADKFIHNNVFLNSNIKDKIYSPNSQKTYALCKIKTQYNNNFVVNNGVECNISDGKYVIETPKIGNTNNRPNLDNNSIGFDYYDTTLMKKILWNGSAWVNLDGTGLS